MAAMVIETWRGSGGAGRTSFPGAPGRSFEQEKAKRSKISTVKRNLRSKTATPELKLGLILTLAGARSLLDPKEKHQAGLQ